MRRNQGRRPTLAPRSDRSPSRVEDASLERPDRFRFQTETRRRMGKRPSQHDPDEVTAVRSPRRRLEVPQIASEGGKVSREPGHLYLLLDSWRKGLCIHKIGIDSLELSPFPEGQLPPPAARIRALVLDSSAFFLPIATGSSSKILIAATRNSFGDDIPMYTYDRETAEVSALPPLPPLLHGHLGLAVATGDDIYVLSSCDGKCDNHRSQLQSFMVASASSAGCWTWEELTPPPFAPEEVVISYAVHWPDATIFMSTQDRGRDIGTYTFDTKTGKWESQRFILPFVGQGLFSSELGAWIGLHRDGYICSCVFNSRHIKSTHRLRMPDLVIDKEKLRQEDYHDWGCEATLTSMGKNKFCLVQSQQMADLGDRDSHVLLLSTFSLELKRNKQGKRQLQATVHQPLCTYDLSRFMPDFPIGALCM